MPFSFDQRGMDEQGRRIRHILVSVANPNPVLAALGTEMADLWRKNIIAGPNPRWEAGPSKRAIAQSGTTLVDTGDMMRNIAGLQTAADQVTIGSTLTVGSAGYNLLSIHEFGATIRATNSPWLTFRYPLPGAGKDGFGWARKKEIKIPRRPTSPFDWQNETLTPEADALVRQRVGDYLVELTQ